MSITRRDKLKLIRQQIARRKMFFRYQMQRIDRKAAIRELEIWEDIERDYTEDHSSTGPRH